MHALFRTEFILDLFGDFGVSFLCDDLPRPREIERNIVSRG